MRVFHIFIYLSKKIVNKYDKYYEMKGVIINPRKLIVFLIYKLIQVQAYLSNFFQLWQITNSKKRSIIIFFITELNSHLKYKFIYQH